MYVNHDCFFTCLSVYKILYLLDSREYIFMQKSVIEKF